MTLKTIDNPRQALQQSGLKLKFYTGYPPEDLSTPENEPIATLSLEHKASFDLQTIRFYQTRTLIEQPGEPTYFHVTSREDEVILRGDVGMDLFLDNYGVLPVGNQLTLNQMDFYLLN
ncbi:MAG: hypothetical protein NXH70_02135 [Hyphomonas sp.]|nr:hypothetical protein [Hyphomonas sp.]